MDLQRFQRLLSYGDFDKVKEVLDVHRDVETIKVALKQYEPKEHDVFDKGKRQDKNVYDVKVDEQGKETSRELKKVVPVNRIALPIQKKIVLTAAAFLGTPALATAADLDQPQQDFLQIIKKIWDDNKLDWRFKDIAKTVMSEKECAILWYTQAADKDYWADQPISNKDRKFRFKLLTNKKGDGLYPVFDDYGDMIAFGHYYEEETFGDFTEQELTVAHTKILHFDVYTADRFYYTRKVGSAAWEMNEDLEREVRSKNGTIKKVKGDGQKGVPNFYGKIPVIYISQPATEWEDLQPAIDRLEAVISNHADTNDYFGSPIAVAIGEVDGFASKGEEGKLLEVREGGDVKYLTWDSAPESKRMEIENLLKFIHTYTHTPDLSFEQMKGLGNISGITIKMMFVDAHLKAADKEEVFGEAMQRLINYLKKAVSVIDPRYVSVLSMEIKPKFEYFMPNNVPEWVSTITEAVYAGVLSKETGTKLVAKAIGVDEEKEWEKVEKDAEDAAAQREGEQGLNNLMGGTTGKVRKIAGQ